MKKYNPKVDYSQDKISAQMEEDVDGDYIRKEELLDWIDKSILSSHMTQRLYTLPFIELKKELEE